MLLVVPALLVRLAQLPIPEYLMPPLASSEQYPMLANLIHRCFLLRVLLAQQERVGGNLISAKKTERLVLPVALGRLVLLASPMRVKGRLVPCRKHLVRVVPVLLSLPLLLVVDRLREVADLHRKRLIDPCLGLVRNAFLGK